MLFIFLLVSISTYGGLVAFEEIGDEGDRDGFAEKLMNCRSTLGVSDGLSVVEGFDVGVLSLGVFGEVNEMNTFAVG